jgi:hypothetical protein
LKASDSTIGADLRAGRAAVLDATGSDILDDQLFAGVYCPECDEVECLTCLEGRERGVFRLGAPRCRRCGTETRPALARYVK